jgi:hypothetical protein
MGACPSLEAAHRSKPPVDDNVAYCRGEDGQDIGDLLQQNRNVQEAVGGAVLQVCHSTQQPLKPTAPSLQVFATLHTLTKNKGAFSVRWTALLVVITFLQVRPSTARHTFLPWRRAHQLLLFL